MVWPTKGFQQQRRLPYAKSNCSLSFSKKKIQAKLMETDTVVSTKTMQRRLSVEFASNGATSQPENHLDSCNKEETSKLSQRTRHLGQKDVKKVLFP